MKSIKALLLGLLISVGLAPLSQAQETPARAQQPAPANAGAASASGGLTNDDVLRLVKAGLGEEMIILKIKQSSANFDTSPETLIKLKEAGVSEAILKAMLNPGSTAEAASYEPGIYLEENGKLLQLEPTVFTQAKGNMLGTALTYGIKKAKFRAVVQGGHARTQTAQSKPVFHFFFSGTAGGLVFPVSGATGPNEFQLVKMEEKKDRREVVVAEARFGVSAGIKDEAMREFSFEKLGPGKYKVVPKANLEPGEYCFYFASATSGPVGGAGGKVFDFQITKAQ